MRPETILVVEDEKLIRWSLSEELRRKGFSTIEASRLADARDLLERTEPDVALVDQRLPDGFGLELLETVRRCGLSTSIIMVTSVDSLETAVTAVKGGVFDYLTKPVDIPALLSAIEKALETSRLRRHVSSLLKAQKRQRGFFGIVGSSPPMLAAVEMVRRVAQSSSTTVLISGESGTGKELIAQAIHRLSDRHDNLLLTVNCAALPEALLENELFGHEKGAFTDATYKTNGIFEKAHQGTVFFDEIGELPATSQGKLLRVLEEKTVRRIGGTQDINVDIRILAATNKDLAQAVERGDFRRDFYYRLQVVEIHLPPLRDRGEDILQLAEVFLLQFNAECHRSFKGISEETKRLLLDYRWPGNVRELRNIMERACLMCDGEYLDFRSADIELFAVTGVNRATFGVEKTVSLREIERHALERALVATGYNQVRAARMLEISRDTLRYRMKKFGLQPPQQRDHR